MRYKLSFVGLLACALLGPACAPKIGDSCKTGTDCSVRGDRICDRAQPGGYCTIANCKPGDCGDDAVCVRFRPDEPRLSVTYCMAKCGSTKDCDRGAYVCRSAKQVNAEGTGATDDAGEADMGEGDEPADATADSGTSSMASALAEVLDGDGTAKFCTAKEPKE